MNKKQGLVPTEKQIKFLKDNGFSANDWLIFEDNAKAMTIIHKTSGKKYVVAK